MKIQTWNLAGVRALPPDGTNPVRSQEQVLGRVSCGLWRNGVSASEPCSRSVCWCTVASTPDLPEETSTSAPWLPVFRMWYWLWPSPFPCSPCVSPLSITRGFSLTLYIKLFFFAFCFLNKPKSKTNQVSSVAFPFVLFQVCLCSCPSSWPSAQLLLDGGRIASQRWAG